MYRRDDILIAVALTRFAVDYEHAVPEFADYALQLTADRLFDHGLDSGEAARELESVSRQLTNPEKGCTLHATLMSMIKTAVCSV